MTAHAQRSFPNEDTSKKLEQLSDEVGRIANELSSLSFGPRQSSNEVSELKTHVPSPSPDIVKSAQKARRLRERYFDAELFSDPAWDILLELLYAELCQRRVSVSSLCIAAHVPATTALRWIASMTDVGLIRRRPDPHDGRRVFIELSPNASEDMHRYFAALAT